MAVLSPPLPSPRLFLRPLLSVEDARSIRAARLLISGNVGTRARPRRTGVGARACIGSRRTCFGAGTLRGLLADPTIVDGNAGAAAWVRHADVVQIDAMSRLGHPRRGRIAVETPEGAEAFAFPKTGKVICTSRTCTPIRWSPLTSRPAATNSFYVSIHLLLINACRLEIHGRSIVPARPSMDLRVHGEKFRKALIAIHETNTVTFGEAY